MCLGFIAGGFAPLLVGRVGETLGLDKAVSWLSVAYAVGAMAAASACLFTFRKDLAKMR